MTGDTLLETLQADVLALLSNVPSLDGVNILAEDEGDTEARILKKLGTLTKGSGEKNGMVIVILQPEITDSETNLPGPPVQVSLQLQVIEQTILNRSENGTGIRSSVAAIRTLHALHLQAIGNALLVPAKNPVSAVKGMKPGYLSHMVAMEIRNQGISGDGKVLGVSPTVITGDLLELTCATSGAAIYYTTDGTYPTPDNGTLYAAAFALPEAGTLIRAAAYKTDLNPSDCCELTVTA